MYNFDLVLVWLGFFASVFLGWYYFLQARNKERMALIERDKDVSEIYAKREIRFRFPWLKLGMLVTGIGFGFSLSLVLWIVGRIVGSEWGNFINRTTGMVPIALMILFGGLSMVIAHYIDKPKNR